MIKIHVQVSDLDDLMEEISRGLLKDIIDETASRMVTKTKNDGAGEAVQRYKPKRIHYPSLPGSPPAKDTDNLHKSITPISLSDFSGEINLANYGGVLEFGTDRAGRNKDTVIKPRPFIIPSLEEVLEML